MSKLSVDQAMEEAAGELPDGYVILIAVENGASCVEMHDPCGNDIDLEDPADKTIAEQVQEAMYRAIFLVSD